MKKMLLLLTLSLCAHNVFAKKLSKETRKRAAFTALGGPLAAGAVGIHSALSGQQRKPVPYDPAKAIESAKQPIPRIVEIQGYGPSVPKTARKIFAEETSISRPNSNEINLFIASVRGDVNQVKKFAPRKDIRPEARKLAKEWITNKDTSTAAYFEVKNILLNNE